MTVLAIVCLLYIPFLCGCHRSPSNSPEPPPPVVEGTYLGIGTFSGQTTNVRLLIRDSTSSSALTGIISLRGSSDSLRDLTLSTTRDTLRFWYRLDGTTYRTWALLGSGGLRLNYLEPAGIPSFRLNRALQGYNMTGSWTGRMTSAYVPESRPASLSMDQESQFFFGEIQITLLEPVTLEINSGISERSGFSLSGNYRVSGSQYAFSMLGSYTAQDTIRGNWLAGTNGSVDQGLFEFIRSFN